jgi:hypothetical protein
VEGNRVLGSDCADSSTPGVFAFTESAGEASLERDDLADIRELTVLLSSATSPRLASREAVLLDRAGRSPSIGAMASEDLRASPFSCSDSPIKGRGNNLSECESRR